MKKKILSKGYTITVVSWENDGDYYNTESMTVDTLEKTLALYNLMMMCNSQSRGGLGNAIGFTDKEINRIVQFFKDNPVLVYDKLVELEYDRKTTTVEELYPLNLPFESGVNPLIERKNNGYSNDDYKYILKKFRKDLDYCTKLVNANKSRMTTDDYYRQMYCTIARYYKRLPLNFKYRSDGCIFGLFSKVTEKDSVENYLKQLDDFEKQLI